VNPLVQIQEINIALLKEKGVQLFIQRDDQLHPFVSGNKWRKLKYNIVQAKKEAKEGLLTFGGAYSNHIAATAAAAEESGLKSIGIIRGEDVDISNPTLGFAKDCGMELMLVSRSDFRKYREERWQPEFLMNYPEYYILPEGGSNDLAVKGCAEISEYWERNYDYACCALGTGATFSGLVNGSREDKTVCIGFPALKDRGYLSEEVSQFLEGEQVGEWRLIRDYHMGGYAKVNDSFIQFLNQFYKETAIPLDPVYTGKMIFGLMDLIQKDYFPVGSTILAVHTGGLQGIAGVNDRQEKKGGLQLQYT
jgi:1-aminocyclopropane-1-carboxylate deaminase